MEKLKNGCIVVLVCTMCILSYISLTVTVGGGVNFWKDTDSGEKQGSVSFRVGAVPIEISILTKEKVYTESHIVAEHGIYKSVENMYFEAIGSMVSAEECGRQEYMNCFKGNAILIKHNAPVPIYLMKTWANQSPVSQGENGGSAKNIMITTQAKVVSIYYKNEDDGKYYRGKTAASDTYFAEVIEKMPEGNSVTIGSDILGYTVLEQVIKQLPTYKTVETVGDLAWENEVLKALEVNPYLAKSYQESQGGKGYVENDTVVKFEPYGRVVYKATENGIFSGNTTGDGLVADAITKVLTIVQPVLDRTPSSSLSLVGISMSQGNTVLSFEVRVDGVPLELKEPAGCVAKISPQGFISYVSIYVPVLSQEGSVQVMSEEMGAGLIGQQNREPQVVYRQEGNALAPSLVYIEDK